MNALPENETQAEPAALLFASLDEFVRDFLAQVVHRRLNRAVQLWCPEWWRHPEAVARLSVLWRAFEFLRHDPVLGLSTWWLHHADPHLHALMNPQYGPFVACDPRDGHSSNMQPGPLPATPAPEELLTHPAFALQPDQLDPAAGNPYAEEESGAPHPPGPEGAPSDDADSGGKRKTKDKDAGREQGK